MENYKESSPSSLHEPKKEFAAEEPIQEDPSEEGESLSPTTKIKNIGYKQSAGLSTSPSSNNSPRSQTATVVLPEISNPNAVFPTLVTGHIGKVPELKKRRQSLPMVGSDTFNFGTVEEDADEDNGNDKAHKLRQIKSFVDHGEFKTKDSNNTRKGRSMESDEFTLRARSFDKSDTLPLEKVQEVKGEEDKRITDIHHERKWKILKDCDEFNFKEQIRKQKEQIDIERPSHEIINTLNVSEKKSRKFSLTLDDEPIVEEAERENIARQSSFHSSHISSPKLKLKVDEIDFERKKSEFEAYQPEERDDEDSYARQNLVIKEDASENDATQHAEELLEKARDKMTSEKEFLKKFLRSESNDEMETIRSTIERDQIIEKENTLERENSHSSRNNIIAEENDDTPTNDDTDN